MNHKTHILMYQNNNGTIKVDVRFGTGKIVGDLACGLFLAGREIPFDADWHFGT